VDAATKRFKAMQGSSEWKHLEQRSIAVDTFRVAGGVTLAKNESADLAKAAENAFKEQFEILCTKEGLKLVIAPMNPEYQEVGRWLVSSADSHLFETDESPRGNPLEVGGNPPAGYKAVILVQGSLDLAEINQTGHEAEAEVVVQSYAIEKNLAGTSVGEARQPVDLGRGLVAKFLVWVVEPWFWIVVGVIGIVLAAAFIGAVPVLRKVFLASKPRRISR
jgi:hypothetical protein